MNSPPPTEPPPSKAARPDRPHEKKDMISNRPKTESLNGAIADQLKIADLNAGDEGASPEASPKAAKSFDVRRAVLMVVAGALVIGGGAKAYGAYTWGQSHVDTDDAYVTGDLVNISPVVSGTLAELKVQDGDYVHKGQLIARLNDDTAKAELDQATANEVAAESQVPQAESALRYTQLSTDAAIRSSQAAIATQTAKTAGSQMQVRLSTDTVSSQVAQAQEQVAAARDQASQALSVVEAARAGVSSARQAVETVRRSAEAAHAAVDAARADADRSAQDLKRYTSLLAEDAISRQQFDAANATAATAAANLSAAGQRAAAADSEVAQARNVVQQAEAQLAAAQNQAAAAGKQVRVAQAGVGLAQANGTQVGIQTANVKTNQGEGEESGGGLGDRTSRNRAGHPSTNPDIHRARPGDAGKGRGRAREDPGCRRLPLRAERWLRG